MQIRRTRPDIKKNDLVLLYHWNSVIDLLFYRGRIFTVGIVLDVYEKDSRAYCDIKGLYTARILKRLSIFRCRHQKQPAVSSANEEYQVDRLRKKAQQFVFLIDIPESDKLIYLMTFISRLSELTDFISHYFITALADRRLLYAQRDIEKKTELLMNNLDKMINEVHKKKAQVKGNE